MDRTKAALLLALLTLSTSLLMAQAAPICDVTCGPDPSAPSYGAAVAARPKLLNARGFSSAIQATAGPRQAPMVIGSQSYNYVIPILTLPGRAGMDLNLNLYYNSRVWSIDALNHIATFNADRDFPSYGFRLDFGYLEYDVSDAAYILTEGDGTKRPLFGNSGSFNSTDGSYINLNSSTKILVYKNGTTVQFATFPSNGNLFRPIRITDKNGNYISISYLSLHDQQIQSVTDTLGRVINFHYDGSDQLSYIDQNLVGGGVHRYVTFTWGSPYAANYHWYNFSGFALNGAPTFSTLLHVVMGCTYANGTGYRFTYGDWAIINKIESLSASTSPIITRSYVSYNYPLVASGALADDPAYTQQTISSDNSTTSVWNYSATSPGLGIVTALQITDPLGNISVSNLDQVTGLLSSTQKKDSASRLLHTTAYTWTSSGGATVPSTITETLADSGQQSSVQYSNYDAFGNPGDVYEYDFGGGLLRHTVSTFAATRFAPQHILDLPTQILGKDGNGNTVARMDFDYDTTIISPSISDAANHDNSVSGHGNLTLIKRYSNAGAGSGAVTRHFYYDSTGNIRDAEMDCCNQKVFNFSVAYQYAYPESIIRGPSTLEFTTQATWSFDYGVMLTSTDENSQVTQYQYDSMNRLFNVTLPPQGTTSVQFTTAFDDNSAFPTVTKSATPSTVTIPTTVNTFDGLGHVLRVDTKSGGTIVSSSTTSYDKLWRRSQASNPFAPGDTPSYTGFTYDSLDRTTQVTPPSSGYTQFSYFGNTTTVTDPAGKQRKKYTDALGRLVQVDEPGVPSNHFPANNSVMLQSGGNFVLFDPYNNSLWSSGTAGTSYGPLEVQDDGNLVLYQFKWQTGTYRVWNGSTIAYDSCRISDSLFAGQILSENQCLENMSNSTFALMTNGDLQIYDRQLAQVTWHSNTWGHPGGYAKMQSDGNLVVYASNGVALWSSSTSGSGANVATLENDGRLILYSTVWNSGTSQGAVSGSLTHPSCDLGWGLGSTGTMGTGQCIVSRNGHFELLLQTDGNLVLSNIGVTPTQILWNTNTALTPFSLDVALHTTYSYDTLGNLTGVSQAAITGQTGSGQSRTYSYDSLGRLTSATTPESGTVNTFYTDSGGSSCAGDTSLPCRVQDARLVTQTLTYDGINRPLGVTYSDGTAPVSYTYDTGGATAFALNRLTKITEGPATPTPINSHTFTYDNLGRIISDSQSLDQQTYLVQYGYNLASEVTQIAYPSGRVVTQNYDAIGRLCSIGASGSTCTSGTQYLNGLTYNAAGEALGLTMGNGVQGNFTYNDHLQLATLRYFKGSAEVLNLAYDYATGVPGNNGQIQKTHFYTTPGVEDLTKSEIFTYDSLSRLSAAQTGVVNSTAGAKTWSLQWTYDNYGNRSAQTMVGGDPTMPVNQPSLTISPTTNRIINTGYTYDAAGNMTHDANAAYTFDGANRLTTINTNAAIYTYFGAQRIKKVSGSATTRYVYSGTQVIAEYTGTTPTLATEYIYSGSKLLATLAGGSTTYHHPDHLSDRVETNSSGVGIRTFGHFPFGDAWYETGTPDKRKFTTYERDSESGETGLDYANFRYHNSGLGRFMSADLFSGRLAKPQSLNRYTYTANDPVNRTDPRGLVSEWECEYDDEGSGSCLIFPTKTDADPRCNNETEIGCFDEGSVGGGAVDIKPFDPRLRKKIWDLLMGKNPCADWLDNGSTGSAAEIMRVVPIWLQGENSQQPLLPPEDATTTADPHDRIDVQRWGRFYSDSDNGLRFGDEYTGYYAGSFGARAVILLHELAHKINPKGFQDDGGAFGIGDTKKSEANTQLVIDKCKDAIDAAATQP